MLMHQMPVHLLSSFYHPVALSVESYDTKIDMRVACASNTTVAVKHWLRPEKYADVIKTGGKRAANIGHVDMITAVKSRLVLLDVASGVPLLDQHFALPRGCKPSRITNRLHREFKKVINSYTESQREQLRGMFGEKFQKLMGRNERDVMLTNNE